MNLLKFDIPEIIFINGSFVKVKYELITKANAVDELEGLKDYDSASGETNEDAIVDVPDDTEVLGDFDYKNRTIRLHPTAVRETTVNTLFHELAHVILEHAGLLDHDEFYIRVFTFGFISLLRENPQLVDLILENPVKAESRWIDQSKKETFEPSPSDFIKRTDGGTMLPYELAEIIPEVERLSEEQRIKELIETESKGHRVISSSDFFPSDPVEDFLQGSVLNHHEKFDRLYLSDYQQNTLFRENLERLKRGTNEDDQTQTD